MKQVLVTGTYGFLGRHTAKIFKENGYHVVGLGHGKWHPEDYIQWGVDEWFESTITFESLMTIDVKFDAIVHCGGSGSVGFSYSNPYEDFQKSVQSTLSILEYIRLRVPNCKFIYPSSPAVQGQLPDRPILENVISSPISPYGFHKKSAEELCLSYHRNYNVTVGIIRFFSIYGPGLQKQLLYDACNKIKNSTGNEIVFFGTGKETRDWINIDDATSLIYSFTENLNQWDVINGASGVRMEIKDTLELLASNFDKNIKINFNGFVRQGDPIYFWADVTKAKAYGWEPQIPMNKGLQAFFEYFKKLKNG
ncbi:NAD-dependent epimerase/dehydratase family protein [Mucilaginibacter paludis]|uniref:NAD-dependent epimerase/dehydratase n=1 Tax=Mucilaginibacter paludis DSM 18603 TaxID=714943 RepID=H1XZN4_9SPHI|nr:NAD(P)-dependent oxidoreductase [Mucilaginibacter paludis]EHQ27726.1 NAD-dependent epimerase/dehydratase [Mucilaginibacter paludis DSM 18603]